MGRLQGSGRSRFPVLHRIRNGGKRSTRKGKDMLRNFIIALVLAASFVVAERGLALPQEQATTAQTKNDYSKGETWLCRPGRQDACAVDLTTTVVAANGKLTREEWTADRQAPIDCFYVYPTVSLDQ